MLSGVTWSASETAGTAGLRMVVSSDSMKNATATSHGSSRLLASDGAGDWSATLGEVEAFMGFERPSSIEWLLREDRLSDNDLAGCCDSWQVSRFVFPVGPLEQPVIEPINDGHERGLVHIAAHACRDPRFVSVGMKADGDAHISSRVVCRDIECGDTEGAEAHLRKRGIPFLQFVPHGLCERIHWPCALRAGGGDGRVADR